MTNPLNTTRQPDHDVDPRFPARWSPRAFTGEALPAETMLSMLEAARWAPSANNSQPWRFAWSLREDAHWSTFLDFTMDGNRVWAADAGALVVVLSKTHYEGSDGQPRATRTHSFDTGAAAMALQLEANRLGYHAHPIGGIHQDKIRDGLGLPAEGYVIEAMIVIGRKADPETLAENLRAREVPSGRKPVTAFAFNGPLPA